MKLTRWHLMSLIFFPIFSEVFGKGAKVRPKNKNKGDRGDTDSKKFPSGDKSTDSTSSFAKRSEVTLEQLTNYSFRNATNEEILLAYLFEDYDPVARAVLDNSKPVIVSVDFVLLRIHGLDERSQVLTTTGLIIAEWVDERLTWDSELFGNISDIIIKADKIWLPELAVMNGADELIPDYERIRVLLSSDGTLHWEPGGIFRTTCDIDIKYFPFDIQHCPLLIGAYSYYSAKMNITNTVSYIATHDFRVNGEWEVYHTSAKWNITVLDCCPGKGYPHVIFTLHIKRRYKFYVTNIVLPCLMLSVLIMVGFFLPPDAGEKISLGISVLLAFTVFLLMIADNIPRTSLAIPLMVIYLTATMTVGTISICMTVLVLNVHHRGSKYPVPKCIKTLMLCYVARLLCVSTSYRKSLNKKVYAKCSHVVSTNSDSAVLDDMELMGLTANNSKPTSNGPQTLNVPESPSNSTHRGRYPSNKMKHKSLPDEPEEEQDYSKEWHQLAHVLDRLSFWVLFILMAASTLFILLYPTYGSLDHFDL